MLAARGIADDRLEVIPNGVHDSEFETPRAVDIHQTCKKFSLPMPKDSTPVCFFLANHTRNKGLDILMDAFLSSDQPYLLIVGGKKRDYDYEGCQSRVKPGQRILFTDALSNEEIRVLHHYSDLFVFPSRADTLPLVILEAMAAGRPILSTTVGGIPFQVDETCGRLVEPENPEALRHAFESMTKDRAALQNMGDAAAMRAKEMFSWERSAELTFDLYQNLLGRQVCPESVPSVATVP